MLIISFLFRSRNLFYWSYLHPHLERGRIRFRPKDGNCQYVLLPAYFLSINRVFVGLQPYNANKLDCSDT